MSATPDPAVMPEHSALLAVDMIGSGRSRPEHLPSIPELVCELTQSALRAVGLGSEAAWDDQFTGDGFLRAYPSRYLPALVDMVSVLDELLATHNRLSKPDIRLRVAVHQGPLPVERGFHRPTIDVTRLLNAAAFKQVVGYCREHITTDGFTTALILSDSAYQTVFQGDYTRVITRNEFAPLLITNNEFREQSWVRIPGVHPTQISSIPHGESAGVSPGEPERSPENTSGERSAGNASSAASFNVSNQASGGNVVIQAGTLHGGVHQGEQSKYVVDAHDAQGVQIGEGNTQHLDLRRSSSEQ